MGESGAELEVILSLAIRLADQARKVILIERNPKESRTGLKWSILADTNKGGSLRENETILFTSKITSPVRTEGPRLQSRHEINQRTGISPLSMSYIK